MKASKSKIFSSRNQNISDFNSVSRSISVPIIFGAFDCGSRRVFVVKKITPIPACFLRPVSINCRHRYRRLDLGLWTLLTLDFFFGEIS